MAYILVWMRLSSNRNPSVLTFLSWPPRLGGMFLARFNSFALIPQRMTYWVNIPTDLSLNSMVAPQSLFDAFKNCREALQNRNPSVLTFLSWAPRLGDMFHARFNSSALIPQIMTYLVNIAIDLSVNSMVSPQSLFNAFKTCREALQVLCP